MKVGLVLDRLDPREGGLAQWTCSLAGFLAERGHDVHVVTFAQANHCLPVTVHVLAPQRGALFRARRVAHALEPLRLDVVHDTGTGWSGDVFHPQTGSRLLSHLRLEATHPPMLRLRAALSPISIARRRQMAWIERRQVRRAKRIIAVSRRVQAQLAAQHGLAADAITVVHNGVDTLCWAPSRLGPLRDPARDRLGVADCTVFLISAHNMRLKGVDTAMRALASLGERTARLVVVGGVPDTAWTTLAAELGVADQVAFLGPVAAMAPLFAAADALVHPTRWDACSLSTIEAGAAGLPVITTGMNGAAELIAEGQTGFVLPDPEDAAALAGRMRMLLDPDTRKRLGAAAHRASAGHDLRHNLAAVEAVLRQASESG